MTELQIVKHQNKVLTEEYNLLQKKYAKVLKKLEKNIINNNLKSIEYKNKNNIQKSILFNSITTILENIYNDIKEE